MMTEEEIIKEARAWNRKRIKALLAFHSGDSVAEKYGYTPKNRFTEQDEAEFWRIMDAMDRLEDMRLLEKRRQAFDLCETG